MIGLNCLDAFSRLIESLSAKTELKTALNLFKLNDYNNIEPTLKDCAIIREDCLYLL